MCDSKRPKNECVELREFIQNSFSLNELRDLCFDLGIEIENLPSIETPQAKSRELLLLLGQQGKLDKLWILLRQLRPKAKFPDGFEQKETYLAKLYDCLESFAAKEKPTNVRLLEQLNNRQTIAFALLTVAVLAVGAFLYFTLREPEPKRMSGIFNIAVAAFDEQPTTSDAAIGTSLAQELFRQLQRNINEVNPGFTIEIWGPEQVGVIQGKDEQTRTETVARLAEEIGAHLVVYGSMEQIDSTWQLSPQFYISTAEFSEADEITGPHHLGSSLAFLRQGSVAELIDGSQSLMARTQILTQIVIGLSYYAITDFDQAFAAFSEVTELDAWDDLEGKEVVYLLTGNAAIRNNETDLAETHYQAALDLAPDYARGYLGMAGVHYLRALEPYESSLDAAQIDASELELAVTNFDLAASAADQPPLANIEEKIHFGMGQIYLAQALAGNEPLVNQAAVEFNAVISAYNSQENQTLRQLAAESYARLGLLHRLSGNNVEALAAYETAVSLLYDNLERKTIYQERVDELKAILDGSRT